MIRINNGNSAPAQETIKEVTLSAQSCARRRHFHAKDRFVCNRWRLIARGDWYLGNGADTRRYSEASASEHTIAPASLGTRINPFDFMKNAKDVPAQKFDAF